MFVNDIRNDKLHFFFIDCSTPIVEEMLDSNVDDSVVPITFIVTKKMILTL